MTGMVVVHTSLFHPHCHCHLCNRSWSIYYYTRQVITSYGEWVIPSVQVTFVRGPSETDWRVSISCRDERELHGGVCIRTIYIRVKYMIIFYNVNLVTDHYYCKHNLCIFLPLVFGSFRSHQE